ncbi:MAG: TRL domain-containing protein [Planctomycetota bacterium]
MRRFLGLGLLACVAVLPSCGFVYTHVTEPLDVNLNETPVFAGEGAQGDTKQIRYQVSIEWDRNGIGDIAKQHGLTTVHYADLTTLTVLGIWNQRFVTVYGE